MAIPFVSALPLAIKLIGKILPSKPKKVIEKMVTSVIATNPDIQAELQNERKFILDYFGRAESLPKCIQIIRSLVRPYCTVLFSTTLVVWLCVTGKLPPEWFCWTTAGMLGWWFGSRSAELWKNRKIK